MKVLRADVGSGNISYEEVPQGWRRYGGRALVARFLLDEVQATSDPLGPDNKLIWAPGLLVGHMLSSVDRISLGGKSPLTGGVKEANAGGSTGMRMAWLDLFALIIQGAPVDDGWKLLYIDNEDVRFDDAGDLVGLGLEETGRILRQRYGGKISVSAIGPGGERQYRAAGITHMDKDGNLTRISARGGLGAVMGSKRLKAIVFDQPRSAPPELKDPAAFKTVSRKYLQALQDHPQTSENYTYYGTAAMVNMCNSFGGLPTRNFSEGRFEGAEEISGEAIKELNESRGGQISHACMAGCTIKCSNLYAGPDGKTIVTPLEYETIGLMGSNLGIKDVDVIAQLNAIANDLGLDSIDIGAALGIAADAGYMAYGDGDRAKELMQEIEGDSALGRILGNGAEIAGKVFGVNRIPTVKGQAISAYDPRAIKGTGVTYATSPQGADHTSGLTIRAKVDHLDPRGQIELSRNAQFNSAGYDSLGACIFGSFGFAMDSSMVPDLINARYDWGVGRDYLKELGRATIHMEREFNKRAGFTSADDRLPEWISREKLAPTNAVFDVPDDELDSIFDY